MRTIVMAALLVGLTACQTTGIDRSYAVQKNLTAKAVLKSDNVGCNPGVEDFENWVDGGRECIAVKTFRSRKIFKTAPTLVIAVHGDGASGSAADRAPKVWIDQIEEHILHRNDFINSDTLIVVVARLGYPIDGVGRSTGHRPDPNGRRGTYRPEYINPLFHAVKRLAVKYRAKKVVGWGASGGSAMLAIGSGLSSSTPFVQLLLGVCPCDVSSWETEHDWQKIGAYSPLDYADKIPKETDIILIVGRNDTNTSPTLSERFLEVRKKAGGAVRIVYTDGNHSGTKQTPEHIAEQLKTITSKSDLGGS